LTKSSIAIGFLRKHLTSFNIGNKIANSLRRVSNAAVRKQTLAFPSICRIYLSAQSQSFLASEHPAAKKIVIARPKFA
jgi:hypothetical protein